MIIPIDYVIEDMDHLSLFKTSFYKYWCYLI